MMMTMATRMKARKMTAFVMKKNVIQENQEGKEGGDIIAEVTKMLNNLKKTSTRLEGKISKR